MAKKRKAVRKKTVTKRKSAVKRKATKGKTKTRRSGGLTQLSYELSTELQAVVGAKKLTRPQVVKKLWAYIKSHKCQDVKNRRLIVPDSRLSEILGKQPVD